MPKGKKTKILDIVRSGVDIKEESNADSKVELNVEGEVEERDPTDKNDSDPKVFMCVSDGSSSNYRSC